MEQHFNQMAEQLVESIGQQQILAEQNARLAERARISRDLHDSIKQQVFAIAMQMGAALSLLEQNNQAAVRSSLQEAESLAYQTQQDLTALIQELRPSVLKEKGLPLVLGEYARTWSRQHQIGLQLYIDEDCTLPIAIEEAFLRLAQEALSNIARHSGASSATITFHCQQRQALLSVQDNGQGFDMNVDHNGVGLHSMRERMEALGGTLLIESTMGEGTCVTASCPCSQNYDTRNLVKAEKEFARD